MATVAVIGERTLVRGWALAGAAVTAADDAGAVRAAWRSLGADVAVVVLTPAAAEVLGEELAHDTPLAVVLP